MVFDNFLNEALCVNDQEQTNNAVTVTLESIYQRVFTMTDFLRHVCLWGPYLLLVAFFAGFTKTKNTHICLITVEKNQ